MSLLDLVLSVCAYWVDGSLLVIYEVVKSELSKTMYLALINFLELSHPPYDITLRHVEHRS